MPLVSADDPRVIEIRRLQAEAAYHKRQVRHHREELGKRKQQIAKLEAELTASQPGEGALLHGHR